MEIKEEVWTEITESVQEESKGDIKGEKWIKIKEGGQKKVRWT